MPIAVETLGVLKSSVCLLLNEIGKRISVNTGESRETEFLFQRAASVLVQPFNAICCMVLCRPRTARIGNRIHLFVFLSPNFLTQSGIYLPKVKTNNNTNSNNNELSAHGYLPGLSIMQFQWRS